MRLSVSLGVLAAAMVCGLVAHAEDAPAPAARLRAELEELAGSPRAEAVAGELERARELLESAERAREGGDDAVAEALLSVVPLQLRLVREMLRAAEVEAEASEAERRSLEAEGAARIARDRLEQVLERLLALSVGRPFE